MNLRRTFQALLAALVLTLLAAPALAQCDDWRAGPVSAPVYGYINATAIWDPDGSGPAAPLLVVGGQFTAMGPNGSVAARNIAAWNGTTWQAFGPGLDWTNGLAGSVQSLIVFNGELYAGGDFTVSDTYSIAKWTGSAWVPLGSGMNSTVYAMTIYNNELVVGGDFTVANGNPALFIAAWNGSSWHAFGSGLDWDVHALTVFGGNLYVGGQFAHAGGLNAPLVAYWNGSWHAMAGGLGDPILIDPDPYSEAPHQQSVNCFTVFNNQLIAGGRFEVASGHPLASIAVWTGVGWAQVGGPLLDEVDSLVVYNGQIVAGGELNSASGQYMMGITRLVGSQWQVMSAGGDLSLPDDGFSDYRYEAPLVHAMIPYNGQLFVGGYFEHAGNALVESMAFWNGSTWLDMPGATFFQLLNTIYALANWNGQMVAGGNFDVLEIAQIGLAKWAGQNVQSVGYANGNGAETAVYALKSYSTGPVSNQTRTLVAGGFFTTIMDNVTLAESNIAIKSVNATFGGPATSWQPLGPGLNHPVRAIERFNNQIVAGGDFTATGDGATTLSHAAIFDGTAWQPMGFGLNGVCYALKAYNGSLYAGGSFTTANGVATGGLARWNGAAWSQVGGTFSGTVYALEVYNNELIIGGLYPGIGGSPNIAKVNGTTYSTLGTGGTNGAVYSLLSENGNLYIGGAFTQAGGAAHNHIARWNGSSWSDVRGGADGPVLALSALNGEVHAAGQFATVRNGAIPSSLWARYLETGIPWIARQPARSLTSQYGSVAFFTAQAALGYSVNYAWRHNGVPLVNGLTGTGSFIAGAHQSTMAIFDLDLFDDGTYDVIVSDSCGSVTSLGAVLTVAGCCGSADFNCDGDIGTDSDIAAFFNCLAGNCPQPPCYESADFNGDGDLGTDTDIEAFFRVLGGGAC